MIYALLRHPSPYYNLAGYVFLGYYEEVVIQNKEKAEFAYRKGLKFGEDIPHHGEYFKGFGYLGLGRLLEEKGEDAEAKEMLELSLKYAETTQISTEAKKILSEI